MPGTQLSDLLLWEFTLPPGWGLSSSIASLTLLVLLGNGMGVRCGLKLGPPLWEFWVI